MLIGLIDCTHRIIQVGRASVLDVISQNMCDDFILREIDQSLDAMDEFYLVRYVKPARIQSVSRKKYRRLTIIDCNACRMVARDWNYIKDPIAQVILNDFLRPAFDAEEFLNSLQIGGDQSGVRQILELIITAGVIAMCMCVRYY